MSLNGGRVRITGGGYEPPLTPEDKKVLRNIFLGILITIGTVVYLIVTRN